MIREREYVRKVCVCVGAERTREVRCEVRCEVCVSRVRRGREENQNPTKDVRKKVACMI